MGRHARRGGAHRGRGRAGTATAARCRSPTSCSRRCSTASLRSRPSSRGHVTTTALRSSSGTYPSLPKVERPPLLIPRGIVQREGRPVRPGPRLRAGGGTAGAGRPRSPGARGSGTRSSRPTCCGWTAPRSSTCRSSSGAGSSRACQGGVPRPHLCDRPAVGTPDARYLGRARLPRPVVPRRELALPGGPGAARLGRGRRPRHGGRRAEPCRAALTTTPPASSASSWSPGVSHSRDRLGRVPRAAVARW